MISYSFLSRNFLTLLTAILIFITLVSSLSIHLSPGDMRCIGQELDQLDYAVFALSATSKVRYLTYNYLIELSIYAI